MIFCQTLPGLPRAARPSGRFAKTPQKHIWSQRETNKFRWFKVEGFGDGKVVVGKFQRVRCPLSGVTKGFMC